jgi:hypothetical protein
MCSRIKRFLLTMALLVFGLTMTASAQGNISPEKRALIKEMLAVTGLQKAVDTMMAAMLEQLEKDEPKRIAERVDDIQGLTPQEREKMVRELTEDSARFNKRYGELIKQKINLSELLEQVSISIFDKYFTEDDLKDLIVFYKSPVGVKIIQMMPQMIVDISIKTDEAMRPKMREIFNQIMEEEKKRSEGEAGSPARKN